MKEMNSWIEVNRNSASQMIALLTEKIQGQKHRMNDANSR